MTVITSAAQTLLLFSLTCTVVVVESLASKALGYVGVFMILNHRKLLKELAIPQSYQLVFLLFRGKCDHDSSGLIL